jgi:hypothetical protein
MSRPTLLDAGTWKLWISQNWPLVLTASFALIWIFHRAFVQSLTMDEVTTLDYWVAPDAPTHWEPHSNNHVLNSTLMRLSVLLFGRSEMALRAPALLGAVIYVISIYRLCMLLASGLTFRWALFVCFIYNPFIMDYLVAARGYGLALGFLSLAIYQLAKTLLQDWGTNSERNMLNRVMSISACAALSFCASFTFAYASGFLLFIACALVGLRLLQRKHRIVSLARLAAASSLPAILVVICLAGSALTRFPRSQLFWGTDSLLKCWNDIREGSFLELSPYLVNPLLAPILESFKHYLFRAMAGVGIVYLVLLWVVRRQFHEAHAKSRLLLSGSLTLVLALTVLAHWVQFKVMKIPLPFERTSLFIVPLSTALVGAGLSVVPSDRITRAVRAVLIAILTITGIYFVGELRDSYFREWRDNAEIKAAFPVVLDLCRRMGVREVVSHMNLTRSLNYYRTLYKASDIDELAYFEKMPPNKPIYVLLESWNHDFIRTEDLRIAWHGSVSDLVILVRPGAVHTVK